MIIRKELAEARIPKKGYRFFLCWTVTNDGRSTLRQAASRFLYALFNVYYQLKIIRESDNGCKEQCWSYLPTIIRHRQSGVGLTQGQ